MERLIDNFVTIQDVNKNNLILNLSQICYLNPTGGVYTIQMNGAIIWLSQEEFQRILKMIAER